MSGVKISKNQLLSCLIQIYSTFNTREHTRGEGATNHPPAKKRMLLPTDKKKGGVFFSLESFIFVVWMCCVVTSETCREFREACTRFRFVSVVTLLQPYPTLSPILGFFRCIFFLFFLCLFKMDVFCYPYLPVTNKKC